MKVALGLACHLWLLALPAALILGRKHGACPVSLAALHDSAQSCQTAARQLQGGHAVLGRIAVLGQLPLNTLRYVAALHWLPKPACWPTVAQGNQC